MSEVQLFLKVERQKALPRRVRLFDCFVLRCSSADGPVMVVSIDRSITGSSYGNDLTATGERAFRITGSFVDRAVLGSDDRFDSAVRITLPADHPGHALERGFQCKMQRHSCSIVKGLNS